VCVRRGRDVSNGIMGWQEAGGPVIRSGGESRHSGHVKAARDAHGAIEKQIRESDAQRARRE